MKNKIDENILKVLSKPDEILKVIVIGVNSSAVNEICKIREFEGIRKINFINAIAGHIRVRNIISFSQSPFVQSIELDQEASVQN